MNKNVYQPICVSDAQITIQKSHFEGEKDKPFIVFSISDETKEEKVELSCFVDTQEAEKLIEILKSLCS